MNLRVHRPRLLFSALFILALATYEFTTFTVTGSTQSTFNLLPGKVEVIPTQRDSGDTISGQFRETGNSPVSFYVLTSDQYATYQRNSSYMAVYYVINTASSDVSYTFPSQDTFYLMFRHGTGLVNTTETIHFQRTYSRIDYFRLTLGSIFLIFGGINLIQALRPRKVRESEGNSLSPTTPPSDSPVTQD